MSSFVDFARSGRAFFRKKKAIMMDVSTEIDYAGCYADFKTAACTTVPTSWWDVSTIVVSDECLVSMLARGRLTIMRKSVGSVPDTLSTILIRFLVSETLLVNCCLEQIDRDTLYKSQPVFGPAGKTSANGVRPTRRFNPRLSNSFSTLEYK